MIDEARDLLARAKVAYQRQLKAIDGKLRVAVSQDPKLLKAALAVQAEYGEFEKAVLAPKMQPDAPKQDAEPAPVLLKEGERVLTRKEAADLALNIFPVPSSTKPEGLKTK